MSGEDGTIVVVVARGGIADAAQEPNATGWSRCSRCDHGVILTGEQATKVAAATWAALCEVCARELAEATPGMFTEQNRIGRSR